MLFKKNNTQALLARITELELLTQQLLSEQAEETRLGYAWSGDLGHWYWNIQSNSVVFNPLKIQAMGYERSELPEHVTYQFFTDRLHPEDYERTMTAMKDHMQNKTKVYEVDYRIRTKNGQWLWFYDRGKITQRDADGKPIFAAGIVFDISEQKEREATLKDRNETLAQDARIDALTGIWNRKAIMSELKGQLIEASVRTTPVSIVLLDIDHFKSINDTYGHVAGDAVLEETTQVIRSSLRNQDTVGRYGGEEFLIVLPGADLQRALKVAERVRRDVEQHIYTIGCRVTISGGVQEYRGEDLTELIDLADQKLYQAKNAGRNQVNG